VRHQLGVRHEPQLVRADQHPGNQVAEHRAQAEPLEERDRDDDHGQEEERLADPEHARRSQSTG
jgi:hypothetical protein